MTPFETNRFLVKFRDPPKAASSRFSANLGASGPAITFTSEPLFRSIGVTSAQGLTSSGGVWRLVTASAQLDQGEAWDHCHDILAANPNAVAVEPDLVQQWPVAVPTETGQKFGAPLKGRMLKTSATAMPASPTTITGFATTFTTKWIRRSRKPAEAPA